MHIVNLKYKNREEVEPNQRDRVENEDGLFFDLIALSMNTNLESNNTEKQHERLGKIAHGKETVEVVNGVYVISVNMNKDDKIAFIIGCLTNPETLAWQPYKLGFNRCGHSCHRDKAETKTHLI